MRSDGEPVRPGTRTTRVMSRASKPAKQIGTSSADTIRASGHDRANRPNTRLHPTNRQTLTNPLQCGSHPHRTFHEGSHWPRCSRTPFSMQGWSVMRPSTPISSQLLFVINGPDMDLNAASVRSPHKAGSRDRDGMEVRRDVHNGEVDCRTWQALARQADAANTSIAGRPAQIFTEPSGILSGRVSAPFGVPCGGRKQNEMSVGECA